MLQQEPVCSISNITNIIMAFGAIVSALVAVVALENSLKQNRLLQEERTAQRRPQLSMKLVEKGPWIVLGLKNTGLTAAQDIFIDVNELHNCCAGDSASTTMGNDFHNNRLELYPGETFEGRVCISEYRPDAEAIPSVDMKVSYKIFGVPGRTEYERTIVLSEATIFDDDLTTVLEQNGKSVSSIARSTCRVANYLDGKNLYSFDEINSAPEYLLRDDIESAIRSAKKPSDEKA